ncbi:MAG: hypothetical protein ACI8P0_004093 [Planctomycetaceae bacterium]|jgi:hypothetical protein
MDRHVPADTIQQAIAGHFCDYPPTHTAPLTLQ